MNKSCQERHWLCWLCLIAINRSKSNNYDRVKNANAFLNLSCHLKSNRVQHSNYLLQRCSNSGDRWSDGGLAALAALGIENGVRRCYKCTNSSGRSLDMMIRFWAGATRVKRCKTSLDLIRCWYGAVLRKNIFRPLHTQKYIYFGFYYLFIYYFLFSFQKNIFKIYWGFD
jgi:hypothetical protein